MRNTSPLFKAPSVWHFVTAVQANYDTHSFSKPLVNNQNPSGTNEERGLELWRGACHILRPADHGQVGWLAADLTDRLLS